MSTAASRLAAASADDVASPCVGVCEIDPHKGFCRGCYRTLDEIAAWSVLDPPEKRAILARLAARRASAARE